MTDEQALITFADPDDLLRQLAGNAMLNNPKVGYEIGRYLEAKKNQGRPPDDFIERLSAFLDSFNWWDMRERGWFQDLPYEGKNPMAEDRRLNLDEMDERLKVVEHDELKKLGLDPDAPRGTAVVKADEPADIAKLREENEKMHVMISRVLDARNAAREFMTIWNDPRKLPELIQEVFNSHPDIAKLRAAGLPVEQVLFGTPHREVIKNIADCLKAADQQGVRHSQAFEWFVLWLLHGFGKPSLREYETADKLPGFHSFLDVRKVLDYWYEHFKLGLMQMYPADYMAFFSQGGANGDYNPYTHAGFFATSMPLCRMMADVTFGSTEGDTRRLTVLDPCAGTGSLLLAASNYSMRLYAQDISPSMVNCLWVNAYLYMPWMVFHPDFSVIGGPTWPEMETMIFQPQPDEQPILVQLPLFPVRLPEPVQRRVIDDQLVREKIRERLETRAGIGRAA